MNYFAPRTCTEIPEISSLDDRSPSLPLEQFRDNSCYVLLGSPGAGKTEAFKKEANQEESHYVTARDFITFEDRTEWHNTTLFIDGLDEMRAGASDQRTPFDQIRGKLQDLGCPRFRLSCREADWFGANDVDHLKDVSPDRSIKVLRLDPLSNEDILKILRCNHNVKSPEQFIASAREKGIYVLVTNPQSLKMLTSAVVGGNWPETRMQTFDLTCRKLLEEHNQEHKLAKRYSRDIPCLLDEAGKLCAIQLLTGNAGYSLTHNETSCEYIHLKEIHTEDQEVFHHVLSTKLFESPIETHVSPIHRQVTEFLGGRYLAKLIQEGLPIRRVLALMTGYDGGIVSELRGLSAWLAAHNSQSRKEIIERDPLGIILYGDVRRFSIDEKRQVLRYVVEAVKKNPSFKRTIVYDPHLEDLATPDMREDFQKTLTDPARDDVQQLFVMFLLETLQHGLSIPELADVLIKIIRDKNWKHEVKCHALYAYMRQQKNNEQKINELTTLLEDLNAGSVPDPNDELLGTILKELYPSSLSTSDVWKYFRTPKIPNRSGSYRSFWIIYIAEQSTTVQLAELLDGLYEHFDNFFAEYNTRRRQFSFFSTVFPALLDRFLQTAGSEVAPDRLSAWLWIVSDSQIVGWGSRKMEIRSWLNSHPEIQKTVFEEWMKRNDVSPYEIDRRLFGDRGLECTRPPDFGLWCLKHAITAKDDRFKKFFLRTAADSIESKIFNKGLSQEIIEETLADNSDLKQQLLESQSSYRNKSRQQEGFAEKQRAREQQELRERINHVKSYEEELRENRCPPHLIHDLARVYFGEETNFPNDKAVNHLRDFLGGNEDLVETVLKAFRESIIRFDVPSEVDIIKLRENNETHHMALPFLAGMEEMFKNDPEPDEIPVGEKQLRQALAFYYNAPLPESFSGFQPFWYQRLLISNPYTVSDVLVSSALSRIHKSQETLPNLYALAFRDDHAEVASLATLQLLERFPVRCMKKQMQGLRLLLKAGLLYCDEEQVLSMVNEKLSHSSMNVAQQICWLAAGLVVSPPSFIEKVEPYLSSNERRVKSLVEFIKNFSRELMERLDVSSMKFFIRLLGSSYKPRSYSPSYLKALPVSEASEYVHRLIQQLASNQSSSASQALEELSSDDSLRSWRPSIIDASYRQKSVRREANFCHCDINQVLETLDNKNPSNSADLSALTMDILTDLAKNIRDGETSDWRQYWCIENNKPQNPQHENECRNRLLSDLKKRFEQLGINASLESHYADSKRPDISIAYKEYKVPIEIKKNDHRELWSAINSQLIAKYARDPETDGYGIYLVFWFGKESCQPPGSGTRPQSAMELKERLIDSLTTDEQRKISVCVIDVAKP